MDSISIITFVALVSSPLALWRVMVLQQRIDALEKRLAWQESLLVELSRTSGLGSKRFDDARGHLRPET
jgi:hypothetical protein